MLRSNLVGTLLALAAWGGPASASEPPTWTPVEAPSVALLDPGASPRRALRYALQPGERWEVARKQSYEASVKVPVRAPREEAGIATLDLLADVVEPSGDAPIELAVSVSRASMRGGVSEAVQGASGRVRYTDRGLPIEALWPPHAAEGSDSSLTDRALLDRFRTRASHLPLPMPDQPVGVGARWEIRQRLVQGSSSFVMIATCTLIEDREDGLDIQCATSHDVDATTVTIGRAGRTRTVEIKESDVYGSTLLLQPLWAPAPVREDGALDTRFVAKVRLGMIPAKIMFSSSETWHQTAR